MAQRFSVLARAAAGGLALVAWGALALQVQVALPLNGDHLGTTLWRMAGYFTVLTNLLVALHFSAVAGGWRVPGRRVAGMVLWIGLVGAVYHAVLARLWAPQGLAWWADQGLHTVVPVLAGLWWLAFCPRWQPRAADVAGWVLWPMVYAGYAVVRGTLTGFWPYPFLDPGLHGALGVALNIAGLALAFALAGALVAAFDHWRFRQARP